MCLNLFEALVKTRVSHTRERLAHEGLVHASLNRVWESLRLITSSTNRANKLSLGWTQHTM